MFWAYLAGLATLPVGYMVYAAGTWLLDRNLELECPDCGRRFGSLKEPRTYTMITELKFKWHRWTGQCKNGDNND